MTSVSYIFILLGGGVGGGGWGMERIVEVVAGTKWENPTILPFLAPKSKDVQ